MAQGYSVVDTLSPFDLFILFWEGDCCLFSFLFLYFEGSLVLLFLVVCLIDCLKEKKKEKLNLGQYGGRKDLGGVGRGENHDPNTLYDKKAFQLKR